MTTLLTVDFHPDANPALATSALQRPALSVVFLDLTPLDFVAVLESAEDAEVEEAVRVLTHRPGVARVEMYPT